MDIALWVVAGLFGTGFVAGGAVKLAWRYERFADATGWAHDFTPGKVRAMGVLEILGGLGMTLPALVGVLPGLVPLAASGMALYMAGAGTERVRRSEWTLLLGDVAFLAAMLFVAWGRFAAVPFT